jgi:hypothetical protein
MSARDALHTHIDSCEQCARSPMTPCVRGGILLRLAAEEAMRELPHVGIVAPSIVARDYNLRGRPLPDRQ